MQRKENNNKQSVDTIRKLTNKLILAFVRNKFPKKYKQFKKCNFSNQNNLSIKERKIKEKYNNKNKNSIQTMIMSLIINEKCYINAYVLI